MLTVNPHPLLDLRAFVTTFPDPLPPPSHKTVRIGVPQFRRSPSKPISDSCPSWKNNTILSFQSYARVIRGE